MIQKSSTSATPYNAKMFRRESDKFLEDPWISLEDHDVAVARNTMLYGENNVDYTR
jgi:hypothetical protein